jgi:sortase (surface protein transpeptidase)
MIKALVQIFLLYLLYKLVFDFIIPLYQTTKQVKKKVTQMQKDMNDHIQQSHASQSSAAAAQKPAAGSKKDDYIDFEEVK